MKNEENKTIIGYCAWCGDPIFEGEGMICKEGNYYHFDTTNPLLNCYFTNDCDI